MLKWWGRGEHVVLAANYILPVELKSCHQLLVCGHYTDLGNIERSLCRGDQTKGNNHSRKRRFSVLLSKHRSHQGMRYPRGRPTYMMPETKYHVTLIG